MIIGRGDNNQKANKLNMVNLLTDRDFWVNYWTSKKGLSFRIPENYLFHKELKEIIDREKIKTAIELGGFPGYYAVFLRKYFKLDVTLLDYFIHPPVTDDLLETNALQAGDIHVIEADLFNHQERGKYDMVLSCGLIEHFNDTGDIVKKHVEFLKPGGTLFITLPNFRALNGWFQRKFDRENYEKHNIHCMDPELLAGICKQEGLTVKEARYFGHFSLWLKQEKEKPVAVRLFKKATWIAGKVLTKIIPFNSKALSPYILIEAKKEL
ncbi:Methyltransferase domain-containing protein [Pedobacter antarcticus]|nr:Methyltransferase domain-containing protein [Pedobacter antarcticus]